MQEIEIRDMTHHDLSQVHAIEESLYSDPWSMLSFSHELGNAAAILKVARFHDQVIGYVCIRSLLDVTHVLKVTVIPHFRRKGIGQRLLQGALRELREKHPEVREVTLEVRESNEPALNLYRRLGFSEQGRRRGYYRRPDEDALIMSLDLDQAIHKFH